MSSPRPARPTWQELPLGDHLLAESPRWDASRQRLSWVDILGGTVASAHWLDGRWSDVERRRVGRVPTAAQPLADGTLAVAVDGAVCVIGQDGTTKQRVVVCSDFPAVRTNDMTLDRAGRLLVGLFTEDRVSPGGGVVAVDLTTGRVTPVLHGYVTANGLAVTPDGEALYAVDTARCTLTRHRLLRHGNASGSTESGRILVQHKGPGVLDGIALGPDGDIWVAVWGAGELRRYSSAGRLLGVVAVPVARPSAVAVVPLDAAPHLVVTTARSHPPGTEEDGTALRPDLEGRLYTTPLMD